MRMTICWAGEGHELIVRELQLMDRLDLVLGRSEPHTRPDITNVINMDIRFTKECMVLKYVG